ncbi:FHA domain-containing protein [Actinoplanes oblitus]|uniref:FHA domain-containing protein n=1 Tax=Actinoplanes oblitus TaxID=3040509 RepID=A0ABY8W4F0_9ACTN|nr:FHA domain-containing protein [Actinoplanes oblitus]WIM92736.1 FHA domain-containing protein [Actinoplanes oblitus]
MPRQSTGGPDAADTRIHPAATEDAPGPGPATITVAGRRHPLNPYGTTLGRDPACDVVLASDLVSRRHAVIRRRGSGFEIEDLDSSNGTRVNGTPISGAYPLRSGDQLELADLKIDFWYAGAPPAPGGSLRQELRQAPGFGMRPLFLAVAGSVAGTVLPAALNSGTWGTLAGAAIGPVISTVFSTKHTGETGRVRAAAIALLSVAALVITVTGFTLGDKATGGAVLPGAGDRTATFPDLIEPNAVANTATSTPEPTAGGTTEPVTSAEPSSSETTDPVPDACLSGFVWREAVADDHVCVPPETRDQALADNAAADSRRSPTGGDYGPDTCLPGYIWRLVTPADLVCVTPEVHDQVETDNGLAGSRRVD